MGVDHALRGARGPGGEEDLRDGVGAQVGAALLDRGPRLGGEIVDRDPAGDVAQHRAPVRHGRRRGREGGVLGDHQPGPDELGHRPQLGVIAALQRVGHARRHDRGAEGHRRERHGEVQPAVAGEDHDGAVGETPVEQALGQAVHRDPHLAPRRAGPPARHRRLGDEQTIRMRVGVGPELVDDRHGVLGQRLGRSQQDPPVRGVLADDPWRGERGAGRGAGHASTSTTRAAPVSPAAQPVNRPRPPPRARRVSISSAIERRPVGPCGWPKTRLQPYGVHVLEREPGLAGEVEVVDRERVVRGDRVEVARSPGPRRASAARAAGTGASACARARRARTPTPRSRDHAAAERAGPRRRWYDGAGGAVGGVGLGARRCATPSGVAGASFARSRRRPGARPRRRRARLRRVRPGIDTGTR